MRRHRTHRTALVQVSDGRRGGAASPTKQQRELVVGEPRHGVDAPDREPDGVAESAPQRFRGVPPMLGDQPWQAVEADAGDAGVAAEPLGPGQLVRERLKQARPGREAGGGVHRVQPRDHAPLNPECAYEPGGREDRRQVQEFDSQGIARCGVDGAAAADPAGREDKRIAGWLRHEIDWNAAAQESHRAVHARAWPDNYARSAVGGLPTGAQAR